MMEKLQLLRIWNRLKRLLRGLIISIGMGKTIDWAQKFAEFMGILEAVADVQDNVERSDQPAPMPTSTPQKPPSTPASPYTKLVPNQRGQQLKDAIAKAKEKKRRRLLGRRSQQ